MENFNELMFEALEDTLRLLLGKRASKLICSLTERQASPKLEEADNNIEGIISYLEKLLGKGGTQVIQTVSIKRLCLKLKQEYEEVESYFLFLDKLYEMKSKLCASSPNKTCSAYN